MTTMRLYFYHALATNATHHASGTFITADPVSADLYPNAKSIIEEFHKLPSGGFVIDALSFLGEYEHETG